MYGQHGTLYPMLAVGAFMSAFWTGIVVGNEMGLGCVSLLILGLLSACTATVGVCELQRRAGRGLAPTPGAGARWRSHQGHSPAGRPAAQSAAGVPGVAARRSLGPSTAL